MVLPRYVTPGEFLAASQLEVVFDHHLHQAAEVDLGLPAEGFACLGRVSQEHVDFRRSRVLRVELDEVAIVELDAREGQLEKLAHGMRLAGRHHVVVGLLLLEHQPHGADVVAGESPVALGVEVPHDELLLQAFLDSRGAQGDLAGHERLAAPGAFVVEQDSRAGEEPVGFPIIDRLPVGVQLGAGVRAARVERRVEPLGRRRRPVHLRARRLIELHRLRSIQVPDRLEQPQAAQADDVGRVERLVERDAHMALGAQVIHLVRPDLFHDHRQAGRVGKVGVVQMEPLVNRRIAREEVVDALAIQTAGTPDQPVHFVIGLAQEELGEIRPVLAGDSRDQTAFHEVSSR